jgi:beta-lactamase regulating signal transducer with metallopeptidase domain
MAVLAWALASAWCVRRLVRSSGASFAAASPTVVVDGIPVVVTDGIGPATAGMWRARVLVPPWVLVLPATQRRYVVRHEDEHRRAHDVALLAAGSILVAMFPWNLALWWQLRRLRLAVELDCDARVVASLGDAIAYGQLLLAVATASSRSPRLQPALLGTGMLERRLTALVAPRQRNVAEWMLATAAAVLLVAIVLSVPHPQLARGTPEHVAPGGGFVSAGAHQAGPG